MPARWIPIRPGVTSNSIGVFPMKTHEDVLRTEAPAGLDVIRIIPFSRRRIRGGWDGSGRVDLAETDEVAVARVEAEAGGTEEGGARRGGVSSAPGEFEDTGVREGDIRTSGGTLPMGETGRGWIRSDGARERADTVARDVAETGEAREEGSRDGWGAAAGRGLEARTGRCRSPEIEDEGSDPLGGDGVLRIPRRGMTRTAMTTRRLASHSRNGRPYSRGPIRIWGSRSRLPVDSREKPTSLPEASKCSV